MQLKLQMYFLSHRFDDIGEDLKKFRDHVKTTQQIKDTRVKDHFSEFFKVQQSPTINLVTKCISKFSFDRDYT